MCWLAGSQPSSCPPHGSAPRMVMVSLPLAVCRRQRIDCLQLAAWHLQSGIGSRLVVYLIFGRGQAADRQERRQSPDQPHSCLFCARRGCMRWAKLIAPAMAQGSGGRERTRRRALVGRLLMLGRCLTFCRLELGVCSHSICGLETCCLCLAAGQSAVCCFSCQFGTRCL